jgi:hypothetical protein
LYFRNQSVEADLSCQAASKVQYILTDVCGLLGFATVSRRFARQLRNLLTPVKQSPIIDETQEFL